MSDIIEINYSIDKSNELGKTVTKIDRLEAKTRKLAKAVSEGVVSENRRKATLVALGRELKGLTDLTGNQAYGAVVKYVNAQIQSIEAEKQAAQQKKVLADQQKQKILLDRQEAEARKKAESDLKREKQAFENLRRSVDPVYASKKKLESATRSLARAIKREDISREEAVQTLKLYKQQLQTANAVQMAATKSSNRMGIVTQQAGYQMSDFIVQVQSGTNPFVAFSQQASQLAGVLPLMADRLKMSATRLIAISSVLGIVIPLVGALGAAFFNKRKKVEKANDALQELLDSYGEFRDYASDLSEQDNLIESFGRFADEAERALEALLGISKVEFSEKLKSFLGTEVIPTGGFQFGRADQLSDTEINRLLSGTAGADLEYSGKLGSTLRELGLMQSQDQGPLRGEFIRSLSAFQQSGGRDIDTQVRLAEDLLDVLDKVRATSNEIEAVDRARASVSKVIADLAKQGGEDAKKKQESREQLNQIMTDAMILEAELEEIEQNRIYSNYRLYGKLRSQSDSEERVRIQSLYDAEVESARNSFSKIEQEKNNAYTQGVRNRLIEEAAEEEELRKAQIARNRQLFSAAENEQSQAYIQGVQERLKAEAKAKADKRAAEVKLNRKTFGKMENDLADSYIEGVKKRIDADLEAKQNRQEAYESQLSSIKDVIAENNILLDHHDNENAIFEKQQELRRHILESYIQANDLSVDQAQSLRDHLTALLKQEKKLKDIADEEEARVERAKQIKELLEGLEFPTYGGDVSVADVLDPRGETGLTQTEALRRRLAEDRTNVNIELLENKDKTKSKRKPKVTQDEIDKLMEAIRVEQTRLNLGEEEARQLEILQDLRRFNAEADIDLTEKEMKAAAAKIAQMEQENQKLEEQKQKYEDLGDFIGDSFEDAMMSIVDGTKSVEDAFRIMAVEIIKELYRVLVVQQAVAAFKTAFGGGPLGFLFGSADGNAFSNGNVIPYADGGVVSSPTYFPMAGGNTGLMGEAGPEAIMPLKRGKDGKLGVQAEGGGTTVVNQTINVSTGVQQTVRTEIKSLMPQIAEGAKNAVLDAKRRGGSYGRTL